MLVLVHPPLLQPRFSQCHGSMAPRLKRSRTQHSGSCGGPGFDASPTRTPNIPQRWRITAQNWPLLMGVTWLGLGSPAATPTLLAQATEKSSPLRRTVPFPQRFASPCAGPPSILGILRRRMERNPFDGKDASDSACGCPHWDPAMNRLGPAIGTPILAIAVPPTSLLEEGPASWSAIPTSKWDLLHLCFDGDSLHGHLCSSVGNSKELHLWSVHPCHCCQCCLQLGETLWPL